MTGDANRSPTTLFYRNRSLLVLSILVILVAGVSAVISLPRLEDPRIVNRNPIVITVVPGASGKRVETLVTEPLEEALQEVAEIKDLESTSRAGVSLITVELYEHVTSDNHQEVISKIRDKIGNVVPHLPPESQQPFVDDLRDPAAYTLLLALRWTHSSTPQLGILNRLAEDLADRMRNVPGTELVRIFGAPEEEITVTVDPDQLAELGLTASQVAMRIRAADAKVPAGVLRGRHSDVLLEVAGALDSTERVASVPLVEGVKGSLLRLGDVAEVRRGWQDPPTEIALVDGDRSTLVAVRMGKGIRVDHWTEQAEQQYRSFADLVGDGVTVDPIFVQGQYTNEQLAKLSENLLAGALVVLLVILLVMGWRQALIVGLALPLVISLVLISLQFSGNALHQMSVFGIIIALGLLIDNAIVVTDEVAKELRTGKRRVQAVADAVRHLFVPLLASTVTTILAFTPILLLPGNAGDFVSSIGESVILSLVYSFVIALTIVAALSGIFTRVAQTESAKRWWRDGLVIRPLQRWYRFGLRLALRLPVAAVLVAAFLPATGFLLSRSLGNEFFPPVDRDLFQVQLWMPSHSSLANTRRQAQLVEEAIREFEATEHVYWLVGGSFPTVYYNLIMNQDNAPHYAQAIVAARSNAEARDMIEPLQIDLNQRFPEAQIVVSQFGQGPPLVADIEFRVFGPSIAKLQDLGEQIRQILQSHADVLHTQMSMERGEPKLWLDTREDEAQVAGFNLREIANQLGSNLEGILGGTVLENLEQLPVRIRQRNANRADLNEIASTRLLRPGSDRWVSLAALGEVALRPEIASITRFDGERCNLIRGFTRSGALPIDVTAQVRERLDATGFTLPPGYRLGIGGATEQDAEAVGNLTIYVPLLVTVTVATLILTFHSVKLAALMGLVAGLSVGLGLLATWFSGFPISFNTILGTLGLMGVALNDSIVVLAAIRSNPLARQGQRDAIVTEVLGCTRHVLSTSLTTIGGFLPLILIVGGDFWPSLAVVLAGGVGGATLLALLLIPAAYAILAGSEGSAVATDLNDYAAPHEPSPVALAGVSG